MVVDWEKPKAGVEMERINVAIGRKTDKCDFGRASFSVVIVLWGLGVGDEAKSSQPGMRVTGKSDDTLKIA